jgi:hypothetical protein
MSSLETTPMPPLSNMRHLRPQSTSPPTFLSYIPANFGRWTTIVYGSTHASDTQITRHSCFSYCTPRHSARSLRKRRGT